MAETPQDDMFKLSNQLCVAFYAASRAMKNTYRESLTKLGLTYPQYLVMLVLWEHGTSTVKNLGQMLSLDSGMLSPLLKRLETTGLVARKRSDIDERSVEMHLTDAGRTFKDQALPVATDFIGRTSLDTQTVESLREHLHHLTAVLSGSSEKQIHTLQRSIQRRKEGCYDAVLLLSCQ
jgi:MarR family transcriptional regulator, organic hydroperoxide resistance regulator